MSSSISLRKELSFFIPFRNEESTLAATVTILQDVARRLLYRFEIVLIDDGSTDRSPQIALELAKGADVRVVRIEGHAGFGAAYLRGLAEARYAYAMYLTADGDVQSSELESILDQWAGNRLLVQYPLNPSSRRYGRYLLSRFYTSLVAWMSGKKLPYYNGSNILPTIAARALQFTDYGFCTQAHVLLGLLPHVGTPQLVGSQSAYHDEGSQALTLRNLFSAARFLGHLAKRFIPFLSWLLVVNLGFTFAVNALTGPPMFEEGVYVAYARSLVEDQDLNIINNVSPAMRWLASPTYNLPDMHSHGIALVWLPFEIYSHILTKLGFAWINTGHGPEPIDLAAIAVASMLLFGLGFTLLERLMTLINPGLGRRWGPLAGLAFGTPAFYYSFVEYTGTEALLLLIGCIFFIALLSDHSWKKNDFAFLGTAAGICFIFKHPLCFYLPIFLVPWFESKRRVEMAFYFIFGLTAALVPYLANQWLEFGKINFLSGNLYQADPVNLFRYNIGWRMFFGPNGFFVTTPLFAVLIPGLFKAFRSSSARPKLKWVMGLFAISCFAKIIYELVTFSDPPTEFGMRHYMADVALIAASLALLIQPLEMRFRKFGAALLSLIVGWGLVYFLWFLEVDQRKPSQVGARFVDSVQFLASSSTELAARISIAGSSEFLLTLMLFLPVTAAAAYLLMNRIIFLNWSSIHWRKITLTTLLLYYVITVLNLTNNREHVVEMQRQGLFRRTVVGKGFNAYLYDEYLSEMGRSLEIDKLHANWASFQSRRDQLFNYLTQVRSEIEFDPIGFSDALARHQMRDTSYDPNLNVNATIDPSILQFKR